MTKTIVTTEPIADEAITTIRTGSTAGTETATRALGLLINAAIKKDLRTENERPKITTPALFTTTLTFRRMATGTAGATAENGGARTTKAIDAATVRDIAETAGPEIVDQVNTADKQDPIYQNV